MRKAIQSGEAWAPRDLLPFLPDLNEAYAAEDQALTAIFALSAVSVLVEPFDRDRFRMCPCADCGWVFADETKNQRRKWCLMETCGNRAKSARHYEKSSGEAGQVATALTAGACSLA